MNCLDVPVWVLFSLLISSKNGIKCATAFFITRALLITWKKQLKNKLVKKSSKIFTEICSFFSKKKNRKRTWGKNIFPLPKRSPTMFIPDMSGPSMTFKGWSNYKKISKNFLEKIEEEIEKFRVISPGKKRQFIQEECKSFSFVFSSSIGVCNHYCLIFPQRKLRVIFVGKSKRKWF